MPLYCSWAMINNKMLEIPNDHFAKADEAANFIGEAYRIIYKHVKDVNGDPCSNQ